jgi:hypothetical protein
MATGRHQRRVADADPEYEPIRPGLRERPAAVHHRGRVAHPDIGDACGNLDMAGGLEDDGGGGKGLPG